MNKNLKISKVVYPEVRMDYNEWTKHYRFGKEYVPPPQLFQNNHYEPVAATSLDQLEYSLAFLNF